MPLPSSFNAWAETGLQCAQAIRPAQLLACSTSSSAVMPLSLQTAQQEIVGVHRILDMCRTAVSGDFVVGCVMRRWV